VELSSCISQARVEAQACLHHIPTPRAPSRCSEHGAYGNGRQHCRDCSPDCRWSQPHVYPSTLSIDKGASVTCCRWMGPPRGAGHSVCRGMRPHGLLASASSEAHASSRCTARTGASRVVPRALYHRTVWCVKEEAPPRELRGWPDRDPEGDRTTQGGCAFPSASVPLTRGIDADAGNRPRCRARRGGRSGRTKGDRRLLCARVPAPQTGIPIREERMRMKFGIDSLQRPGRHVGGVPALRRRQRLRLHGAAGP
jgi:hypothetical protein